ncbi:MAG: DUF1311 domain-containing protein [Hyphomonadaceae bacterium]|nr:DUF1311 domain-containing protein [Hyphomonadaceae bacterium]
MILRLRIICRHQLMWASGLAFVLALGAATPAFAQSQAEMNMSARSAYRAAEAEMSARLDTLRNRLGPESKSQLETAQRDWVKFSRSECGFRTNGVRGGSAYPMVVSLCMEEVTRERSAQLQRLLACEEGDMTCPF